jgi:hypothetical protein
MYWLSFVVELFLNKCHEDRQLSFSQRTSALTLLFKKDDPLTLDNYRPISLLLLLTILMDLYNLLNSSTEFEHIKAQYFYSIWTTSAVSCWTCD